MPYASSIQTLNDANGAAYGFLEVDGLLWQYQWNPQAERWDKAQVVPGAYGGEKLQALLVDNLWPTSGSTGDQEGNTPGIVLAYRIGSGEAAQVYATLGQWNSDGQLSWHEPLLLTDSGAVTEAIALRSNGDGRFELISQRRTPVAADPGNTLQTITGARSDSELIRQSFSVSGSGAIGYQLGNITTGEPDPSPAEITPTSEPAAVAPASATAGSTQFSRAELQVSQSQPLILAASSVLESASSDHRTSASELGSTSGIGWRGYTGRFNTGVGAIDVAAGIPLAQFKMRWSLQVPQSGPPMDWSVKGSKNALKVNDLGLKRFTGSWNETWGGKEYFCFPRIFWVRWLWKRLS